MEKVEIKVIGVIIMVMILLSFTQAELDIKTDGFLCKVKCAFKCEPQLPFPGLYSKCIEDCRSHCSKLSSDLIYNCVSSCRLMKSIANNISAYDLVKNVINTCMKECVKKL
ncbi:hypothetical protein VNO80_25746 [Phaseolus coccineus]|uniref:Uncharacterized protein n=1 Tax=Phaseolus coccineus TaxID=3886 RepID=A0AAN9LUR2_PHACN